MKDIQNEFLTELMDKALPTKIIMSNGFQLAGQIIGFDQYVISLDVNGKKNLLYKANVSTVREEG